MTGRILIAGIGNVFLGDDGFGVAVVARLKREVLPPNVRVVDTGIRARDLAYELLDGGYETAILVDALARGDAPGTVSLLEPMVPDGTLGRTAAGIDGHAMTPDAVLAFLRAMGPVSTRILIVGCEPECLDEGIGLSAPVTAAIDEALALVRELVKDVAEPSGHRAAAEGVPDPCA